MHARPSELRPGTRTGLAEKDCLAHSARTEEHDRPRRAVIKRCRLERIDEILEHFLAAGERRGRPVGAGAVWVCDSGQDRQYRPVYSVLRITVGCRM